MTPSKGVNTISYFFCTVAQQIPYLALVEDRTPIRYLASWILSRLLPALPVKYVSSMHKTTINIAAAFTFIYLNNTPENQRQKE